MSEKPNKCQKPQEYLVVRMVPILKYVEQSKTITPTKSSFGYENLKRHVNFHPEECWPCDRSWERDLSSSHVRNRRIKDAPFYLPKCCVDIFNHLRDRSNARRLRSYHLDKRIRPVVTGLPAVEEEKFVSEFDDVPCHEVLECCEVKFDSSDESDLEEEVDEESEKGEEKIEDIRFDMMSDYDLEDKEIFRSCLPQRNESDCSGCSTLGTGFKRAVKRVEVTYQEILKKPPPNVCDVFKAKNVYMKIK